MSGSDVERDLSVLVVGTVGRVEATGEIWEPYRLVDPVGGIVSEVALFLKELQAAGRTAATARSYAMDLLRWYRFLWAIEVPWAQATRVEARDFCRWLAFADKPRRVAGPSALLNAVTGKRSPGRAYAPSTLAHSETVLRAFYAFHQEAGSGPMVNPFPLVGERYGTRAHAHHNPMEPFRNERAGRYRPRVPERIPRSIPDDRFNQIFAQLGSNRDRALVALWVSTGARASELLGARCGDVDPGQQLITVVRKGSRALQQLPACADAFVWLRLYQCEVDTSVSIGRDEPLW
jgi:integrase